MGNRLRDGGREHPADDTAEQEPLPGPTRRLPGRIVSLYVLRITIKCSVSDTDQYIAASGIRFINAYPGQGG